MLAKGGRRPRISPAPQAEESSVPAQCRKERAAVPTGPQKPPGCESDRVSEVVIKEGESFETALKRFMRKVQQDGLLSEAKRRQHYEPPSVKRKRKADARARKARKARAKAAAQGL